MKNIIITGATSFIAVNLINEIISSDVHVYAVVRPQTNKMKNLLKSNKITIIESEMKDYFKLESKINKKCDVLFSFAWNGTRGIDRDNHILQNENYRYSIDALQAAINLGCSSIISAGSQAEYGLTEKEITEESPCNPVTEYGKQKLRFFNEASKICIQNKILFKEPRFFSIYGIDDYEGSMISSILKKMMKNESCDLTECVQKWDFLHVKDAAKGLVKLIETDCQDGVYNFGSGIAKPLKDYVLEMQNILNSKSQLNFGSIPFPVSGMMSIQPNVRKLMVNCDWQPEISFQDGIKEIIDNIKLAVPLS